MLAYLNTLSGELGTSKSVQILDPQHQNPAQLHTGRVKGLVYSRQPKVERLFLDRADTGGKLLYKAHRNSSSKGKSRLRIAESSGHFDRPAFR